MAPRSAILALTFALLVAVVLSEGPQCGLLSLEYDDYNDVDDDEGNRGSNSGSSGGRNGRSNSGSSGGSDPTTATTAAPATPPPGALSVPTTASTMVAAVCPQLKGKYQCCSDDYFNNARLKLKNQDLRNGFSMQAQPRVTGFRSLANSITEYSQNTFNDDFGNNFANYTKIANVPLNINPMADTFNVAQNVRQWIENGLYTIANSTSNPTCVGVQVASILNSADVDAIVKDVGLLRNASSVFYLIDQYIANISDTILALVPPSDQCANTLLKLTCSKCQQSISKLCRNFNILWDVTSQLVQFLNKTLTDMFAKQDAIKQALIQNVRTSCSVDLASNLTISIRPQGIGYKYLSQAKSLLNSGLLTYGPDGPVLCNSTTQTSSCWTGERDSVEDEPEFDDDSIQGQDKNPAGSFNVAQLSQEAKKLGTPVNTFLNTSVVSSLMPAAITIPQGQVYQPSSATTVGVSLLLMIVAHLILSFY
ncbi:hypothetical protein EMCRGX_G026938 [Ephydatia muelleri]